MKDIPRRDLYRIHLRDQAQVQIERDLGFWVQLMTAYPGRPAQGTQMRRRGHGRKRLVLVQL